MKLIKVQEANIDEIENVMDLIFDEWGSTFSSSRESKLEKIKNAILSGAKFPQLYILKDNNKIIGSFNILEHELDGSDLSPWLACVVVNKEYRGKGYGSILLKYIEEVIEQNFNEIYLTTEHIGFYEKIGFKLMKIIDNNGINNRLYSRTNKKN